MKIITDTITFIFITSSFFLITLIIYLKPNKYNHPILVSLWLIFIITIAIIPILISTNINLIVAISYIVLVRGIIIIFIYFARFTNNTPITDYTIHIQFIIKCILIIIIYLLIYKYFKFNFYWIINEINSIISNYTLINNQIIDSRNNLTHLYIYNKKFIIIFLAFILFFRIRVIVFISIKICDNKIIRKIKMLKS